MKKIHNISMSTWSKLVENRKSQVDIMIDLFNVARTGSPKSEKRLRGHALYHESLGLRSLMRALEWDGQLVIDGRGVFVVEDGVWFDAGVDDRFFWKSAPIGRKIARQLDSFVKDPKVIVDIGANVGTVSLYLAARYRDAAVYAFEASAEAVERIGVNLRAQPSPLENVVVVHAAVSDRAGEVRITRGKGTLNHLVGLGRDAGAPDDHLEVVASNTLRHYVERYRIDRIDFLKVNIEGSEPLLTADMIELAGRISVMYVEFSDFSDFASYETMFHGLRDAGFCPFVQPGEEIVDIAQFCRDRFETAAAVMIWFVKRDLL